MYSQFPSHLKGDLFLVTPVVWVELVHALVGFGPMEGQCIYRIPQQHMLENLEGYFLVHIQFA
jgi:hypothetical protein